MRMKGQRRGRRTTSGLRRALAALGVALLAAGVARAGEFERGTQALALKDYPAAVRHFHHGAFRGDRRCQHFLAVMLLRGAGTPEDPKTAAIWLRRAANQGLAASANALGSMHLRGRGVARDPERAAHWFQRTALHGDATGQTALGVLHMIGLGVGQDDVEAAVWLSLGQKGGQPAAAKYLAQVLQRLSPEQRGEVEKRVAAFEPRRSRDKTLNLDRDDLLPFDFQFMQMGVGF